MTKTIDCVLCKVCSVTESRFGLIRAVFVVKDEFFYYSVSASGLNAVRIASANVGDALELCGTVHAKSRMIDGHQVIFQDMFADSVQIKKE